MENQDAKDYAVTQADIALDAIEDANKHLKAHIEYVAGLCSKGGFDISTKDMNDALVSIDDVLGDLFRDAQYDLMEVAGYREGFNPKANKSAGRLLFEALKHRDVFQEQADLLTGRHNVDRDAYLFPILEGEDA